YLLHAFGDHIERPRTLQRRDYAANTLRHRHRVFAGHRQLALRTLTAEAAAGAADVNAFQSRRELRRGLHHRRRVAEIPGHSLYAEGGRSGQPAHDLSFGVADREEQHGRLLFRLREQFLTARIFDRLVLRRRLAFRLLSLLPFGADRVFQIVGDRRAVRGIGRGEERRALAARQIDARAHVHQHVLYREEV